MSLVNEAADIVGPVRIPRNTARQAGHGSIHDDATASKLGFRGGTVAGSLHMDQFAPLVVKLYGEDWWKRGNMSFYFRQATVDRETVRALGRKGDPHGRLWMENEAGALIVTASAGARADARRVDIRGGRTLKTLRGSLEQVIAEGAESGDAYLRVILAEKARAGLGDLVREKLPNALEVQLDEAHRPRPGQHGGNGSSGSGGDKPSRAGRTPLQLFGDYLAEQEVADERVERMFAGLLEEMTDGQTSASS